MHLWWCHLFSGAFIFNMYPSDISVKFHFTDMAPCRPSRATGPSNHGPIDVRSVNHYSVIQFSIMSTTLRFSSQQNETTLHIASFSMAAHLNDLPVHCAVGGMRKFYSYICEPLHQKIDFWKIHNFNEVL